MALDLDREQDIEELRRIAQAQQAQIQQLLDVIAAESREIERLRGKPGDMQLTLKMLEAFGEHWVLYTAKEGYGEMFSMFGGSFKEFLHSLDALHTHIGLSFSQLKPPTFSCEDLGEGTYLLSYFSTREGLAPMMVGLLRGLAAVFGKQVEIQHVKGRAEVGHDEFHIRELPVVSPEAAPEAAAS